MTDQELVAFHSDSLIEFDRIESAQRQERLQCLQDRRFYSIAGAQWEGSLGDQFANKPMFEINKIHLAIIRIIGDYRNNRITVDFNDKSGGNLADVLDGMYRSDEQDSNADEAYDTAFEDAVGGGFGAWRVRSVYEDPEDEDEDCQRIAIEPIHDADSSIYFDLGAKRQDKRDAKICFVVISMTPEDFEEKWPGHSPSSWDKTVHQCEYDWVTPDIVYIAEKYQVEKVNVVVHVYETIDGKEERYTNEDFENDPELKNMLEAVRTVKVGEKKLKKQRVRKYLLSGMGILEDYGYIAGTEIPIVPVFGKRWFVDNLERMMGHVRLSKDVQRLKNMQTSKLAEISALSPVEKPIFTTEQVMGHQIEWSKDNLDNYPYLTVNSITDKDGNPMPSGPIGYTKAPDIPQPLAALLALTDQDMKDLLGNPEAGKEIAANLSGRAVELVQAFLDTQTFIYMSNFAKAIKRSGEIWLSMAKEIFVEDGREIKLVDKNDETSIAKLNIPVIDEKTGEKKFDNDISKAKCTVSVDVGPSSSTKRSATVRALTSMTNMTQDPETAKILNQMILMNVEGEGVEDARDYFRMQLVRQGVLKPTAKETVQLQKEKEAAKPTADEEFLKAAAKKEEALAGKARADTAETLTEAEKNRAKTLETLAGIDRDERQTAVENLSLLNNNQTAPTQPL